MLNPLVPFPGGDRAGGQGGGVASSPRGAVAPFLKFKAKRKAKVKMQNDTVLWRGKRLFV
jgi:hypothetical protein